MNESYQDASKLFLLLTFSLNFLFTFPRRIYFPMQNVHLPTQNVTGWFCKALIINYLELNFEGQFLRQGTE